MLKSILNFLKHDWKGYWLQMLSFFYSYYFNYINLLQIFTVCSLKFKKKKKLKIPSS